MNVIGVYVIGFRKTDPNRKFGISKIINLEYLTHYEFLVLGYNHAKFKV